MLYNMIRFSAGDAIYAPPHEIKASLTTQIISRQLATKRPLDLLDLDAISTNLGRFRDLQFLVCIRDPRDLVTSRHRWMRQQFFQGADYQFYVSGGVKAFANPGVAACYDALKKAETEGRHRLLTLRYEDLIVAPERARQLLCFATGFPLNQPFAEFHAAPIPPELSPQLNGIRSVETFTSAAWTRPERLTQAYRQVTLFPELEEIAKAWGYPPFAEVVDRLNLDLPSLDVPRGTIVAFHTDDELYRAEATRFRKSVERLGLSYDITVVPPKTQWTANCAMKPEILADARKRLRGPLLYVDVDAFVHNDPWPYLSQYDGDVAFHVDKKGTLNSATIWIADTNGAHYVLDAWLAKQRATPETWDQETLRQVIKAEESNQEQRFVAQRLPYNMAYIFDRTPEYEYGPMLIEQLQASRASVGKWGEAASRIGHSRAVRVAELDASVR